MAGNSTCIHINVDNVASFQSLDVAFEGQGAGVFHGIEEDGRNLATYADTAVTLVGNMGDVVADMPEHRVGGGFSG